MGKHRKPYQSSKPEGLGDLVARPPGRHRAGDPEPEPWVYSPDANPDATVILDPAHGPGSTEEVVTEPEGFWEENDQYDDPSDGRSRLAARAAVLVSAVALMAVGGVAYLLGRGSAEEAGEPGPAVTVTVTEPDPTVTVKRQAKPKVSVKPGPTVTAVRTVAGPTVRATVYRTVTPSPKVSVRPGPTVTVRTTATVRECFEADLSGDLVETNCP